MNPYAQDPYSLQWFHATPTENVPFIEREGLRADLCIDEAVHLSQHDRSTFVHGIQLSEHTPDYHPSLIALYQVSLEGIPQPLIFEGVDDDLEDCAVGMTIPPQNLKRIR